VSTESTSNVSQDTRGNFVEKAGVANPVSVLKIKARVSRLGRVGRKRVWIEIKAHTDSSGIDDAGERPETKDCSEQIARSITEPERGNVGEPEQKTEFKTTEETEEQKSTRSEPNWSERRRSQELCLALKSPMARTGKPNAKQAEREDLRDNQL